MGHAKTNRNLYHARIPLGEDDDIFRKLAAAHNMTEGEYLRELALLEVNRFKVMSEAAKVLHRLKALEDRLGQVEEAVFG